MEPLEASVVNGDREKPRSHQKSPSIGRIWKGWHVQRCAAGRGGGRNWGSRGSLKGLHVLRLLFFKRLCSVPCPQSLRSVPCPQVHSVQMLQCPLLPLHHPEEHAPGDKAQVRGGHQRHLPHQPGDLPHVSQGAALGRAVLAG